MEIKLFVRPKDSERTFDFPISPAEHPIIPNVGDFILLPDMDKAVKVTGRTFEYRKDGSNSVVDVLIDS